MATRICRIMLASIALVIAPALHAASVQSDYDHSTNFSSYKTYSWLKVNGGNSLWSDRLRNDVDSQLAAKGWTLIPSGGDAVVSAFRSTKNQKTLNTFYDGFGGGFGGGGWGWRGFGGGGFGGGGLSTTTTSITKVGNVVVDIFDGHSHKLLWRASDGADLSSNADKNINKLQKDVAEMFKKFPPK